MLAAMANTIEKMERALRLLGQRPAQHAHHRRNADAACNEHRRHGRIGIEKECTRWRLHLKEVAFLDLVVQMSLRRSLVASPVDLREDQDA